jgi:hypothetical protein
LAQFIGAPAPGAVAAAVAAALCFGAAFPPCGRGAAPPFAGAAAGAAGATAAGVGSPRTKSASVFPPGRIGAGFGAGSSFV